MRISIKFLAIFLVITNFNYITKAVVYLKTIRNNSDATIKVQTDQGGYQVRLEPGEVKNIDLSYTQGVIMRGGYSGTTIVPGTQSSFIGFLFEFPYIKPESVPEQAQRFTLVGRIENPRPYSIYIYKVLEKRTISALYEDIFKSGKILVGISPEIEQQYKTDPQLKHIWGDISENDTIIPLFRLADIYSNANCPHEIQQDVWLGGNKSGVRNWENWKNKTNFCVNDGDAVDLIISNNNNNFELELNAQPSNYPSSSTSQPQPKINSGPFRTLPGIITHSPELETPQKTTINPGPFRTLPGIIE